MSSARSQGHSSKHTYGGKLFFLCNSDMASFRRYGNSDLAEMYPIWNFHLSIAY